MTTAPPHHPRHPDEPELPPALPWLTLGAVLSAFVSAGALAQALSLGWGLWFSEAFCFLAPAWVMVRLAGADPAWLAGLRGPTARAAALGLGLGAFNYLAGAAPLMAMAEAVFPPELVQHFDSARIFEGRPAWELAVVVAGVSLAAPLAEEFFFRGVLQSSLERRLGGLPALLLASCIFSALHLDPVGFAARLELGLVFGWLWRRTGSLWPGVFAHAGNNLVSSLLFLLAGDADRETSGTGLLVMTAVGALGLAAVAWAWRRTPMEQLAPRPSRVVARAPVGLWEGLAPWLAAAGLSLAPLYLVDARGVQLALHDLRHPATRAERRQWESLRARVRAGEAPVEEYLRVAIPVDGGAP